jgi:hypothetical protein
MKTKARDRGRIKSVLGRLGSEDNILAIVQGVLGHAPSLLPVPICSIFSYFFYFWSSMFYLI